MRQERGLSRQELAQEAGGYLDEHHVQRRARRAGESGYGPESGAGVQAASQRVRPASN